jgi:hypothetical protein
MKTKFAILFLSMAFCAPAFAHGSRSLQALADETGLTVRQVAMILGPSSSYLEYKASYSWVKSHFINALGQRRYEALLAGRDDGDVDENGRANTE